MRRWVASFMPARPRRMPVEAAPAGRLNLEPLESRQMMSADLYISEFMADNTKGLTDQDAEFSDWIEVHNPGADTVNLAGWSLTDNPALPAKWVFPSVNLAAGQYMLVFASGKDRRLAGAELHANFKLDDDGEYLALVKPDQTVAAEFSPTFPRQYENASYGIQRVVLTSDLVAAPTPSALLVPSDGSLGASWTGDPVNEPFDDSASAGWRQSPSSSIGHYQSASDPLPPGPIVPPPGTQILNIDFNHTSFENGNTQPGFTSFTTSNLGAGLNIGGVVVNLISLGGDLITSRDRDKPIPDPPDFTYDQIYDDFLFSVSKVPGEGIRTRISGLVPGEAYHLTLWSFDDNTTGSPVSRWVENSGPAPVVISNSYSFNNLVQPTTNDQYSMSAVLTASNLGELYIDGTNLNNKLSVFINALRLVRLGYAGQFTTNVQPEMAGANASLFYRSEFTLDDPVNIDTLQMSMQYDDGFVAWINGVQVLSVNAPASPGFDSAATAAHPNLSALLPEVFNLNGAIQHLRAGTNVLAIQGLNRTAADGDFLLKPHLQAIQVLDSQPRFFTAPTPGAANGSGFQGFMSDVDYSAPRGFYEESFDLTLTNEDPLAQIIYTLDGSAPTLTHGTPYAGSIPITMTTMVRAAAFRNDFVPSEIDTKTYFFLDDVIEQTGAGLPVTWRDRFGASVLGDYAMDPDVVNDPRYAATIKDDLRSLPTLSIVMDINDLFGQQTGIYSNPDGRGDEWERPASAEWIETDGVTGFHIDAGIRIMGASGRALTMPKHSLRLAFRSQYGESKLEYPIFPGSDVDEFDTLALRAGNNLTWPRGNDRALFVQDQFARETHQEMGGMAPDGTWTHLYLNGVYWGVYNILERPDADYAQQHLGGEDEDYNVLNNTIPVDGTNTDWFQAINIATAGVASPEAYASLGQLIDIPDLVDYMILNMYVGNLDWDGHNWIAIRNETQGTPYTFVTWDAEIILGKTTDNITTLNNALKPTFLYTKLRENAEFRLLFADHLHKHFFNDGVLTPQANADRWTRVAAQVGRAMVAESARWGDSHANFINNPLTYDDNWLPAQDRLYNDYFPVRTANVLAQFTALGLYPNVAAPVLSQHGGDAPSGYNLSITGPGTLYYTLDGSDPRLPGGTISPNAIPYSGAVTLLQSTQVLARAFNGSVWSALTDASFTVALPPGLLIAEIMYNPPEPTAAELAAGFTDNNLFEFIELMNAGAQTLNLAGLHFSQGINFNFADSAEQTLAPGQRMVLARHAGAFGFRYPGVPVAGYFTNSSLSSSGETLAIVDAIGSPVLGFEYDDDGDWPGRADGNGSSAELIDPAAALAAISLSDYLNDGDHWRSSVDFMGSPGAAGTLPHTWVIINEILSNPGDMLASIELHNTTLNPIDVSGWWLSDTDGLYTFYQFPLGSVLPPLGYLVITEADYNPNGAWNPNATTPGAGEFSLDLMLDDELWLLSGMIGSPLPLQFVDHVKFGPSEPGVSLGRVPDGDAGASLFPNRALTLGGPNSPHLHSPLVISQIMYHHTADLEMLEFLEIHNRSHLPVDLTNWRVGGGVDFDFPPGLILPAHSSLVLLPFDPAEPLNESLILDFEAAYGVFLDEWFIGPFLGSLADEGERLQLLKPGTPPIEDPGFIPHLLADEVRYDDHLPWPETADGMGDALHRYSPLDYGDHFTSWRALPPSPGRPRGDMNGDHAITAHDIDLLFAAILPPLSGDWIHDLNGDSNLDTADVKLLIEQILGTHMGDANLDGEVSIGDLVILAMSFDGPGGWADGDFNGDSIISIGDLTLLAEHFGASGLPEALTDQDQPAMDGSPLIGQAFESEDDEDDADSTPDDLADILADLGEGLR